MALVPRIALVVVAALAVALSAWIVYLNVQPILAGRFDRRRARKGRRCS